MSRTPLPSAQEVRELFEGLLGRDVDARTGTSPVNPAAGDGACVGVYVDDALQMRALVVMDVPLACYAGSAIALIPAARAGGCAEAGVVESDMLENTNEILNVAASLFNPDGAPHLRLYRTYAPLEPLPQDVAKYVLAYVARLDMELDVAGYGSGEISVLVI